MQYPSIVSMHVFSIYRMPSGGRLDGSKGGLVDRLVGLNEVTVWPALVLLAYTPEMTPSGSGGRSVCSACCGLRTEVEIFSFLIGARGILGPAVVASCDLFPSVWDAASYGETIWQIKKANNRKRKMVGLTYWLTCACDTLAVLAAGVEFLSWFFRYGK